MRVTMAEGTSLTPGLAVCRRVRWSMRRRCRDHRDFLVAVERRRRRQRPFERRRSLAPVIGADPFPEREGVEHDEYEEQRRGIGNEGADRRDEIPAGERV